MQRGIKLTETEWYEGRKTTIGASDVATICGLNPYKSPFRLWAEKTGKIEPEPSSLPARVGKVLEPLIASEYTLKTGRVLENPGEFTVFPHPEFEWLRCTPDRIAYDSKVGDVWGAVEMKSIGEMAARDMKDDPKIEHTIQLQIQLACLGLDRGDIIVLIGNRKTEIFSFELRPKTIEKALDECKRFYECLITDTEPEIDGHESTSRALQLLHPDDNGDEIVFSEKAVEAALKLEETKARIKELEMEKREAENIIKAEMGDATYGSCLDIRYSLKTQERKGFCKVDISLLDDLENEGYDPTVTSGSKFRVLRKSKALH